MSEGLAAQNSSMNGAYRSGQPDEDKDVEGLDNEKGQWGDDYPIDEFLIRQETRTIHDVVRRIKQGTFVMNPDFQRDFIWPEDKQSKLIESVLMRIPLPVFYMAEDDEGRMIVVDGLQRLSTFQFFLSNKLRLRLSSRSELDNRHFSDLPSKWKNRIEDCNLIFYIIDSRVPERARLDIFERVNGGVPLSRQQMRNCLFMGLSTTFLTKEAKTDIFLKATGESLNWRIMRDREFVNRFCAFSIIDLSEYKGDMDDFLATCLRRMNRMNRNDLANLSQKLRRSLDNNFFLFEQHAFRKYRPGQKRRSVLNASLWDVMATGLSHYKKEQVEAHADSIRYAVQNLLGDPEFNTAITYATNGTARVQYRFKEMSKTIKEILGAYTS